MRYRSRPALLRSEAGRALSHATPSWRSRAGPSVIVVSRQALIESGFSTVVCAPVFSERVGLPAQVPVGTPEALKRERHPVRWLDEHRETTADRFRRRT